jgi:hypothetical protein
MERETGIEPATNSLEGCDSTTELLPLEPSFQLSAVSFQQTSAAKAAFHPDFIGMAEAMPFHKTFLQKTILKIWSR